MRYRPLHEGPTFYPLIVIQITVSTTRITESAISSYSLINMSYIMGCSKPEAVLFKDNSTAIKADKSSWTATADSETPDGWENTGKASALLDGNTATYWHTDYLVSPTPGYPHWVLIDMKSDQHMVSVAVTNRQAATPNRVGMKKFRLEGSKDGQAFTHWVNLILRSPMLRKHIPYLLRRVGAI